MSWLLTITVTDVQPIDPPHTCPRLAPTAVTRPHVTLLLTLVPPSRNPAKPPPGLSLPCERRIRLPPMGIVVVRFIHDMLIVSGNSAGIRASPTTPPREVSVEVRAITITLPLLVPPKPRLGTPENKAMRSDTS